MRGSRALFTVALLAVPALLLVPTAAAWGDDATNASRSASAQAGPGPAAVPEGHDAGAARRYDPDNKSAIAEWMEKCVQGNAKYVAHDVPGAVDMYRQAVQLAPKKALPLYLLGEAQMAAGSYPDAEASLKNADAASDDRDVNVRGKILFVTADLKERRKKWDEARAAWQAYGEYSSKHADAGLAPTTPAARIQAIDDMLKQDKAYEVVRQRIADEAKNAAPPPAPPTADAGKKRY